MPAKPPRPRPLVLPRKPPNANGSRSTRIIRWQRLCLPLLLLLPSCAKEPPRYVVVSANRACSGVYEKFTDKQIAEATGEARVKMLGHNKAHETYCKRG
jgi:hypothetical protein